jgi:hypothetical protein
MAYKYQEFKEWEENKMISGYSKFFGEYFVHISLNDHVVGYGYKIQLPTMEIIYPGEDGQAESWTTLEDAKADAERRMRSLPGWLEKRASHKRREEE